MGREMRMGGDGILLLRSAGWLSYRGDVSLLRWWCGGDGWDHRCAVEGVPWEKCASHWKRPSG